MPQPKEKPEPQYKCPITDACSTRKLHRRCRGGDCDSDHCWDCCEGCQYNCQGPSDKPEDRWEAPEEDAGA